MFCETKFLSGFQMVSNRKKRTLYAQVHSNGQHIMMVDVCVQPSYQSNDLCEGRGHSYNWFTEEHFSRLTEKIEDVILARVLSAPEKDKKKGGKMQHNETPDILNDPELLIQYHFEKRTSRQAVLISSSLASQGQQISWSKSKENIPQCSVYSGEFDCGCYQSYFIYPEKLKITVSQITNESIVFPLSSLKVTDKETEKGGASSSSISKYFAKEAAAVTRSAKKNQKALKNINRRVDPQVSTEYQPGVSPFVYEVTVKVKRDSQAANLKRKRDIDCVPRTAVSEGELMVRVKVERDEPLRTARGLAENCTSHLISCVDINNEPHIEIPSLHQESIDSSLTEKQAKSDSESRSEDLIDRHHEVCDTLEVENAGDVAGVTTEINANRNPESSSSCAGTKRGIEVACSHQVDASSTQSDVSAINTKGVCVNSNQTTVAPVCNSESDSECGSTSTEFNVPSLRTRLAQRRHQKQVIAADGDNDFESPKAKRNVEKRKGSELTDDKEEAGDTTRSKRLKTNVGFNPEEFKYSKGKGKTKKLPSAPAALNKKEKRADKGRGTRQEQKSEKVANLLQEVLEEEEPVSSLLDLVTIEDKPPSIINVSSIEELSEKQIEQLVWSFAAELKEIFQGKRSCRRHVDYKEGGLLRGDLAFQVHFGTFSEDQQDTIMGVLISMFCYKHSKYFDYVSKVLLPETLVMLYMRIKGGNRDEAELLLFEGTNATG